MLTGDDYIGLAGERRDCDEVTQRVVRKMPSDRGAVSVGTGIDQQRVAITGRLRHDRRRRSAAATGMILDHYGPPPARRKRFGEHASDDVRATTDAKGLD